MSRTLSIILLLFICIAVLGQDKDKPREGEGMHAFLKRNNRDGKEYQEKFIELNQAKLGKNNTLRKGVTYTIPPLEKAKPAEPDVPKNTSGNAIGTKKRNPLFGKKYEEYTIKSHRLRGACFFLSSGHGGPDCGAIGKADGRQLHEDEYAYDITLRLARNLMEEGATVYMIIQDPLDGIRDDKYLKNSRRETCMGATIPLNQKARLKQRSDKINELAKKSKEKYKRSVFIHLDSRSQKRQLDVFFYYSPKSKDGKKLADTMRETFRSHYDKHQPNRGFTGTVTSRSLYVLDKTTPIGLFAELGNIQNSFDQRRFLQYDNRQALANWLCRGFIKDYEDSKKK